MAPNKRNNTNDVKLKKIKSAIRKKQKVLIMMRGLPGSGKTTLAKEIVESTVRGDPNQFICEYKSGSKSLPATHKYNKDRVSEAVKNNVTPVIIDNTNTQAEEMKPYVQMAIENGYDIEVLEPDTEWCWDVTECAKKTELGVPEEQIKEMKERYEHGITAEQLIEQLSQH